MKNIGKKMCALAIVVGVLPTALFAACENDVENPIGLDQSDGIIGQGDMTDMSGIGDGSDGTGEIGGGNGQGQTVTEDKFTVTASEWQSAFSRTSFENCTVNYSATADGDVITILLKADKGSDKIYLMMTDVYNGENVSYEAVAAKSGDNYYGYSKSNGGEWGREKITEAEFNSCFNNVFEDYLVIDAFKTRFEDFSYDEEDKAYKAEGLEIDDATCEVSVTMKNGRISAITVNAENDDEETFVFTVTVTDYNETEIEIPTVTEDSGDNTDLGGNTDSGNTDMSGNTDQGGEQSGDADMEEGK